jgi:hypothetical protein
MIVGVYINCKKQTMKKTFVALIIKVPPEIKKGCISLKSILDKAPAI